jgi:membrane protein implicated in regulation of membrane protease activity
MSWAEFYLVCFAFGFILSLLSLLGGIHLHLPHVHFQIGGPSHAHQGAGSDGIGPINFGTVTAFLAWFGGTGYLLTRFSGFWFLLAFGLACLAGLVGAAIVFFFVAKVLIQKEEELDPADYHMVGVLGIVSSNIRPSGTGELIFSQGGTRRATPARSEEGIEITKGTEVVVTRFDRGIAYVRRWEELTKSPVVSE